MLSVGLYDYDRRLLQGRQLPLSGSSHNLDVRVVTVKSRSDCPDIYYVVYNGSDLPEDQGLVDSLYCTDYAFDVTVVDSTVTHSNGSKQ